MRHNDLRLVNFWRRCRGGLADFHNLRAPTFAGLTYEFIASMKRVREGSLQFNVCDQVFTLDMVGLRRILGITREPSENWKDGLRSDDVYQFWHDITHTNFDTSHGEPGSAIPNPAIRICHKVLVMCFLGNVEVVKLTRFELEVIWCLVPGRELVPDWAELFIMSILRFPDRAGKIGFGGMVTTIALEFVGLDRIRELYGDPVPGGWAFDMKTLRTASCARPIDGDRDMWCWLVRSKPYLRLPHPLAYGESDADFCVESDFAAPAPAPGWAPRTDGEGSSSQVPADPSYGQPFSLDSLGMMMQDMMSSQRAYQEATMTRFNHFERTIGELGTWLDGFDSRIADMSQSIHELQDRHTHYHDFYQQQHQATASFWAGHYPDYPAWLDYHHPPPPEQKCLISASCIGKT